MQFINEECNWEQRCCNVGGVCGGDIVDVCCVGGDICTSPPLVSDTAGDVRRGGGGIAVCGDSGMDELIYLLALLDCRYIRALWGLVYFSQ